MDKMKPPCLYGWVLMRLLPDCRDIKTHVLWEPRWMGVENGLLIWYIDEFQDIPEGLGCIVNKITLTDRSLQTQESIMTAPIETVKGPGVIELAISKCDVSLWEQAISMQVRATSNIEEIGNLFNQYAYEDIESKNPVVATIQIHLKNRPETVHISPNDNVLEIATKFVEDHGLKAEVISTIEAELLRTQVDACLLHEGRLQKHIAVMRGRCVSLLVKEQQLQAAERHIAVLSDVMNSIEAAVPQLQARLTAADQERRDKGQEVAVLSGQLRAEKHRVGDLQRTQELQTRALQSLHTDIATLKQENDQQRQKYDQHCAEITRELHSSLAQLSSVQEQFRQHTGGEYCDHAVSPQLSLTKLSSAPPLSQVQTQANGMLTLVTNNSPSDRGDGTVVNLFGSPVSAVDQSQAQSPSAQYERRLNTQLIDPELRDLRQQRSQLTKALADKQDEVKKLSHDLVVANTRKPMPPAVVLRKLGLAAASSEALSPPQLACHGGIISVDLEAQLLDKIRKLDEKNKLQKGQLLAADEAKSSLQLRVDNLNASLTSNTTALRRCEEDLLRTRHELRSLSEGLSQKVVHQLTAENQLLREESVRLRGLNVALEDRIVDIRASAFQAVQTLQLLGPNLNIGKVMEKWNNIVDGRCGVGVGNFGGTSEAAGHDSYFEGEGEYAEGEDTASHRLGGHDGQEPLTLGMNHPLDDQYHVDEVFVDLSPHQQETLHYDESPACWVTSNDNDTGNDNDTAQLLYSSPGRNASRSQHSPDKTSSPLYLSQPCNQSTVLGTGHLATLSPVVEDRLLRNIYHKYIADVMGLMTLSRFGRFAREFGITSPSKQPVGTNMPPLPAGPPYLASGTIDMIFMNAIKVISSEDVDNGLVGVTNKPFCVRSNPIPVTGIAITKKYDSSKRFYRPAASAQSAVSNSTDSQQRKPLRSTNPTAVMTACQFVLAMEQLAVNLYAGLVESSTGTVLECLPLRQRQSVTREILEVLLRKKIFPVAEKLELVPWALIYVDETITALTSDSHTSATLAAHADQLQTWFSCYSTEMGICQGQEGSSSGEARLAGLPYKCLSRFAHDFGLIPYLLKESQLHGLFQEITTHSQYSEHILSSLLQCDLVIFSSAGNFKASLASLSLAGFAVLLNVAANQAFPDTPMRDRFARVYAWMTESGGPVLVSRELLNNNNNCYN